MMEAFVGVHPPLTLPFAEASQWLSTRDGMMLAWLAFRRAGHRRMPHYAVSSVAAFLGVALVPLRLLEGRFFQAATKDMALVAHLLNSSVRPRLRYPSGAFRTEYAGADKPGALVFFQRGGVGWQGFDVPADRAMEECSPGARPAPHPDDVLRLVARAGARVNVSAVYTLPGSTETCLGSTTTAVRVGGEQGGVWYAAGVPAEEVGAMLDAWFTRGAPVSVRMSALATLAHLCAFPVPVLEAGGDGAAMDLQPLSGWVDAPLVQDAVLHRFEEEGADLDGALQAVSRYLAAQPVHGVMEAAAHSVAPDLGEECTVCGCHRLRQQFDARCFCGTCLADGCKFPDGKPAVAVAALGPDGANLHPFAAALARVSAAAGAGGAVETKADDGPGGGSGSDSDADIDSDSVEAKDEVFLWPFSAAMARLAHRRSLHAKPTTVAASSDGGVGSLVAAGGNVLASGASESMLASALGAVVKTLHHVPATQALVLVPDVEQLHVVLRLLRADAGWGSFKLAPLHDTTRSASAAPAAPLLVLPDIGDWGDSADLRQPPQVVVVTLAAFIAAMGVPSNLRKEHTACPTCASMSSASVMWSTPSWHLTHLCMVNMPPVDVDACVAAVVAAKADFARGRHRRGFRHRRSATQPCRAHVADEPVQQFSTLYITQASAPPAARHCFSAPPTVLSG